MNTKDNTPAWLDTQEYPFKNKNVQLDAGNMHYIDEGQGEVILFVHGTPTWSFLYRNFIKELSQNYRCIAIDHIGFGLSEKPNDFPGRPQEHSRNLLQFIEKLGLENITLVVHDFGGPIGLGAAIQQPHLFKRIVLFNTWLWETKDNPAALKVDKIINSWLGKILYLNFNFSPKVLLKKGFSDQTKLPKHIHQQYIEPFPNKASRCSLLRIGQSLVGSSNWYQLQWDKLDMIADKPWLILWGMKDEFITAGYLKRWKERLPNAKILELDCGHFVQEEEPAKAISAIKSFIPVHNHF